MKKKTLLLAGLLIAAVALFIGWRSYNATVAIAEGNKPEHTITAEALYNAFQDDETTAGTMYNDKLVQVSGEVKEVSTSAEGRMSILLDAGVVFGSVVCEFTDHVMEPAVGSIVSIKGYCAGFNFDVLLQRCAFADDKTNP